LAQRANALKKRPFQISESFDKYAITLGGEKKWPSPKYGHTRCSRGCPTSRVFTEYAICSSNSSKVVESLPHISPFIVKW
jgi:hypothetical protein